MLARRRIKRRESHWLMCASVCVCVRYRATRASLLADDTIHLERLDCIPTAEQLNSDPRVGPWRNRSAPSVITADALIERRGANNKGNTRGISLLRLPLASLHHPLCAHHRHRRRARHHHATANNAPGKNSCATVAGSGDVVQR